MGHQAGTNPTEPRLTCAASRIRKIKCDEGKPACLRCTTTGRKCDGYTPAKSLGPAPWSVIPWGALRIQGEDLGFRWGALKIQDSEARSLSYFHRVVAPSISSQLDQKFWKNLVLQVGVDVAAVRHATIAVSSIYEDMGSALPKQEQMAIQHYNHAIRHLVNTSDEQVVLLSCILFVCIECMRGNGNRAIEHCRHGTSILNRLLAGDSTSRPMLEDLREVFCRLSIFPFFFGSTPLTFPPIADTDTSGPFTSTQSPSFTHVQRRLDVLISKAVRLVRKGDGYRFAQDYVGEDNLYDEQSQLDRDMRQWESSFLHFKSSKPQTPEDSLNCVTLEMKYSIARIWARNALESDEKTYDVHTEDFRRAVTLAAQASQLSRSTGPCPKFRFDMGFMPLLYFVTIKCRHFETRLDAFKLMHKLAVTQENLWSFSTLDAVSRRTMELEHGLLPQELEALAVSEDGKEVWPTEVCATRVIDSSIDFPEDAEGGARSKRVTFVMQEENGSIHARYEWLRID